MNVKPILFLLFSIITLLSSCKPTVQHLPYLGSNKIVDGEEVRHQIRSFNYIDQDSLAFNADVLNGNIYLADFFFTSCPSICPVMTKQLLRVHDAYLDYPEVTFLSHTIDPIRDSIQKLAAYANKIGVTTNEKWHFVTGEKDALYGMAEHYMIIAFADDEVPGGFEHSGYFILVDKEQQIRGYYDGTSENDVTKLIEDLEVLLDEY